MNADEIYVHGLLLERSIAFRRILVDLGIGITGALMLSQCVCCSDKTKKHSGWFCKTRQQWTDETGMSRTEQEGARKKLRKLGVLQEKKHGVPCKVYFKVDFANLLVLLEGIKDNK